MLEVFYKSYKILPVSERRKFVHLQILVIIVALIDAAGVASILPFISILTDPDIIHGSVFLTKIYNFTTSYGVDNDQDFLIFSGFSVLSILSLGIILKGTVTYLQFRFVYMQEYLIGSRLFEVYLNQPYKFFLSRNSAELTKNLVSELNIVINQVFMPVMNLISQFFVTSAILMVLFLINFGATVVLLTSLLAIYLLLFLSVKKHLTKLGNMRFYNNEQRFKVVNDSFKNIKELKILNAVNYFSNKFQNFSYRYAASQTSANLWSQIPKFFLELIIFCSLLVFILILLINNVPVASFIPIISVYVFAAYRLMPAIQHIYGCVTVLRFSSTPLNHLHSELFETTTTERLRQDLENIIFEEKIELVNISMSHIGKKNTVLNNLNLEIKKYSHTGIIGKSGGGKSTLLNIISGLLVPDNGAIEIDGKSLKAEQLGAWFRLLGYVSQDVYLADIPLSENIALGLPRDQIDYQKLRRVCEMVDLADFIETELHNGYDSLIGENGSQLSGGQRQRVSIARALYKYPQILILDEATSSLDKSTEQNLVDLIEQLKERITIISVAHNQTALAKCDKVYSITNGQLQCVALKNQQK